MSASDAEKPMTPPQVTERDWDLAKRFMAETGYDEEDTLLIAQLSAQARQEGAEAGVLQGWRLGLDAAVEAVKHLSHEDGLGMGSQRMEQAITGLVFERSVRAAHLAGEEGKP